MTSKAQEILYQREIQGIQFSLRGKMIVFSLLIVVTFLVANSLYEIFAVTFVSLLVILVLYLLLKILKIGKFVQTIGLFSVAVDLVIVTVLPFIWYNSVGGDATVPRTYLVKTYLHFIIAGFLIISAFSIQPLYPMIFSFGVVLSQAGLLIYAQQDPRFSSTESFKEAVLGPSAHVNSYIMSMAIIGTLGFFLAYLTFRVRKTIFEAATNEVRMNQLSRYFSPNIASELASASEDFFRPGGHEANIAIMFTDIVDFTKISEQLGPEATLDLLSEYHSRMLDEIFKFQGTLDKFIGDGMMVTFGTPIPSSDDATNALNAGIGMMKRLAEWNEGRKGSGLFPIAVRIGIHFGKAIVGNVGIESRMEYTVIGDTVNVASRLEAKAKELKVSFLVSGEFWKEVNDSAKSKVNARSMGSSHLRGKQASTELFSVGIL